MEQREVMPLADMKVLMNHIYEYKKGVRQMVLYTFNEKYRDFAVNRLEKQSIDYIIQPVGNGRVNLFFGKRECMAGHPTHGDAAALPTHARGGLHPRRHARLRHLRPM